MKPCPTCGVNVSGYTDLLNENTNKIDELRAEIDRMRTFMRSRTLDGEHTELDVYKAWRPAE